MSVLIALILGIVQGLTEFLPVSSSGHLMLIENIFNIHSGGMFFNVLLHFATLIAIVIVFWKDVVYLIKNPFSEEMKKIVVATIPTVIIALLVETFFDEFSLMAFVGFGFLISSIVISITAFYMNRKRTINYKSLNYKNSLIIGLIQGLAVFPGISRSGSTICAGLVQGIRREESAKFSFLISVPVILGGMIFELIDGVKYGFGDVNVLVCVVGFISAFIVALFTIKFMMNVVKNGNWWWFAVYLLILSIVVLLNQYIFCWF